MYVFFFQAEDGIRYYKVTGVQTCALPISIEVDLRDAVLGAEREISVNRPVRCPECKGSGARPGSRPQTCPQCGGSGEILMGGVFSTPCPRCQGEGTIREPCPRCGGEGTVPEITRPKVKVPPGVETGSRVRLPGQGGPGQRGGEPGDLYLRKVGREAGRERGGN